MFFRSVEIVSKISLVPRLGFFNFARTEWTPGRPADLCTRCVSHIFRPELPMRIVPCTTSMVLLSVSDILRSRLYLFRRASGQYTVYSMVGSGSV